LLQTVVSAQLLVLSFSASVSRLFFFGWLPERLKPLAVQGSQFDQGNDVRNRPNFLHLGFADLPAELVLERKDDFNQVKTVSAQILDQTGSGDYAAQDQRVWP
jgi:hypothetical protein